MTSTLTNWLPESVKAPLRRVAGSMKRRGLRKRLARMRRELRGKPSHTPGEGRFDRFAIRYNDAHNFYVQYKDEFVRRVYHFASDRPDPLIIDGGSNIGMSIISFKSQYPEARIIGFEPDPQVFELLKHNVESNGLQNVELVQAGLAGTAGKTTFTPDDAAGGQCGSASEQAYQVDVVTLSEYLKDPVDLLKLNIEGLELEVLQEISATSTIRNVKQMIFEYHGWSGGKQKLGRILSLLDAWGFRYMVHDFDRETNPNSKPPFRFRPQQPWFCLVYASREEAAATLDKAA